MHFRLQLKAKDETTGEPINADALIERKYEEYRKDFLVRQVRAPFFSLDKSRR